ncbi:MAG: ABC transporter permease subunit [Actinomycetota bacterium]
MTVEGYLSAYFLALWWIIIVGGYVIAFATAIVGKEIADGTIEILLAQPISRTKIILGKFLACLFYLAILTFVTIGSTGLLALFYDVEIKTEGLLAVGFLGFLFFAFIAAFSLFLSVILKERGRVVILSVAFLIASHLLNALADLSETLKDFRFLSIFKYYNSMEALKTGNIPWSDALLFLGLSLLCLIASILIFRREDIAIV